MIKYLKKFETHEEYEGYVTGDTMVRPNVSYCEDVKDLHYNPIIDYSKEYFTTEALESGTISFIINSGLTTTELTSMSYSIDNGETWTTTNNTDDKSSDLTIAVNVNSGDKVLWKGVGDKMYKSYNAHSYFRSTNNMNILGNIMSLIYGDNYKNQLSLEGKSYCFYNLFYFTKTISAENLILPATTLAESCYGNMFESCSSLATAPQLPATTLAESCYEGMFSLCTSLATAPQLPATTLADACYSKMFWNCSGLTTVSTLSATTLNDWCYYNMFESCTSLTSAPELPATTLANGCYGSMFQNCRSLNYIKAMFTTEPSSTYTSNWVSGVAANGTFVKNSAATWNVSGVNGVPNGWTVETAS